MGASTRDPRADRSRPRPAGAGRSIRLGRARSAAMIAVDSSAMVAIVLGEPERDLFTDTLRRARRALISTVSVVEVKMVIHSRRGQRGVILVDDLLRLPTFEIAP